MGNYKNGIYVAFDGGGDTSIESGDIKIFNLMKAWVKNDDNFNFVNSHEKTGNVRDDSKIETLKVSLRERLNNSKKMILILSNNTNFKNKILNWEIKYAIDMKMPIYVINLSEPNKEIKNLIQAFDNEENISLIKKTSNKVKKEEILKWINE